MREHLRSILNRIAINVARKAPNRREARDRPSPDVLEKPAKPEDKAFYAPTPPNQIDPAELTLLSGETA